MTSKENSKKLQQMFDDSPFDDIKVFVEPNANSSAEAVTKKVIEAFPQLLAMYNGETKGTKIL